MVATTASDPSGVQYYFHCLTTGGHDSGWQASPTYQDTGLSPSTAYSYQVMTRDQSANQNTGSYSTSQSATTQAAADTTPPTPNPSTWLTAPYATGPNSIQMVATTASDPSGVQYYFQCLTSGGHDSSWQVSETYQDTVLSPSTSYSYQVRTRDQSANQNTGSYSISQSATTSASTSIISLSGDLAFGAAAVGSELDNFLTIHNSGTGTLHVTNVICPAGFTGSWSGSIAAGSSTDVLIAFQPTLPASYRGAIVVSSDAGSGTNTIAVSGTGTSTDPHNPNIAIAVKIQPGNALVMTWPTNAVGFQLEFATNLVPSAIWSPVGTAATIVNGQYVLTNSVTGRNMYFRLHQQ
jgi:hypothetical protein